MRDTYREVCINRYKNALAGLSNSKARQRQCMIKMIALIKGRSHGQIAKMEHEKGLSN